MLNPPSRAIRDAALRAVADARQRRLATEAPSSLSVYEYDSPLPSSAQWNGGVQLALPWSTVLDVEYVGQHGYNIVEGINLNAVDFGTAYLPQYQDPTLGSDDAWRDGGLDRSDARVPRIQRDHAERVTRLGHASLAADLVQPPLQSRPLVRIQRHDRALEHAAARRRVCSTTPTAP